MINLALPKDDSKAKNALFLVFLKQQILWLIAKQ